MLFGSHALAIMIAGRNQLAGEIAADEAAGASDESLELRRRQLVALQEAIVAHQPDTLGSMH